MLSVKQEGVKYYFLVWLDLELNPGLSSHCPTLYPIGLWAGNKAILTEKFELIFKHDGLSLTVCQAFEVYFIPKFLRIAFIVRS